jgi:hypothetical protein
MKNLYAILIYTLLMGVTAFGQGKVDYTSRSRFYLDLNLGGTYHSNTEVDVNRLYRGGAGFAFGYSFGMKPQNLLSLDLQVRYLLAAYRGISDSKYTLNVNTNDILDLNQVPIAPVLDYENAYGYYVPNFHSWVNDWSLELKLNTNRLRENTGWDFFALGGIGTTRYSTRVDFYDMTSAGQVKLESDLFQKKILYSDYETKIVNKRDWMPSFGLGIERQITPNAAFQVMGRMTWTRNNDFDGLANTFSGTPSASNDRYHYASAGIKFYLRGHKNNYANDDNDPVVRPNPNPPVQGQKPVAKFTLPATSPLSVSNDMFTVQAIVQNVAGKQNITLRQNGLLVSTYNYNANTDKLSFPAKLLQGQNTFVVSAVNNFGKAEDQTVIIYNPVAPPIVTITNPSTYASTVSNNSYGLLATVLNVENKQNISLLVNGLDVSNFTYNVNNKQLAATLNLVPGKNIISVTGTNSVGSDSKTVEIVYNYTVTGPPPVVNILSPNTNPSQTTLNTATLVASVSNVGSKNDITIRINGVLTNSYNYAVNTGKVTLPLNLVQGSNTIAITGTNQYGQDDAATTIIYQPVQNVQPPVVTINSPNNGANYAVNSVNVQGTALYVNSKNDLNILVNGNTLPSFSFNTTSKVVSFTAGLVNGNNTIQIIGVNADGQDQATVNVVYNQPAVVLPPVVNIIDPAVDNKVYTVSNISVKASVLNVNSKSNITVTVNGNNTNNFTFVASNHTVTIPVTLSSGNNTVVVSATNTGGSDSKQRLINYKRAVVLNPPTVDFTNPSVSPVTVKNSSYAVVASTTNITSKNQITLRHNGVLVNSSAYSFVGSNINYPATLANGSNVFEVVVANASGTDSKSTTIVYEKEVIPCTKPTIGYVAPAPNSTVTTAGQNIEAQINNHIPGTTVTLKLNGVSLGAMTYNSSSQIANKAVTLNQGVNTLEITVSNSCGTNKSTFIINYNYTAPCIAPLIKISSSATTTSSSTYLLSANITNVTATNQVTLKVNGTNHTFNLSNGKLTATVTLSSGSNVIVVTATNTCGTDKKSITVNYVPCQSPKLALVKPLGTAVTTVNNNYDFALKVSGTVVQSDITAKLNGKVIAFTYNASLKTINISASNLMNGSNTLEVSVKNACGSDSVTYRITANLCVNPVVSIATSQNARTITVNSLNYAFSGVVSNMPSKTGVLLVVNGKNVAFNFNASTGKVTASVTLKEGSNTIILSATNACGADSKLVNITAKTCDIPKLVAVSPKVTTTTDQLSQSFIVSAAGVTSVGEVVVKLNGVSINKTLSNGKILITAKNLKLGLNTLTVVASNNCGTDKVTFNVTRKTCDKPTIKVLSTAVSVSSLSYPFSATLTGVSAKQSIVLKVNNKTVPFTYSTQTGKVTSNLTLTEGANTIVLTANNKCGNSSKTHVVTATTCKQPEIKVGYPTNTNITTANSTFTIIAIGINVTQSEITVTNNGAVIPFTFSSATGKITVAVSNMRPGDNNIKIKGANACGSSEVNYVLTYTGSRSSGGKIDSGGTKTPQKRN